MQKRVLTSIPVFFIFSLLLFVFIRPYYLFLTRTLKISLLKTLLSFDSLKSYDNQVNILFLGIAGGTHQGPYLTDSIIVANYNFKKNQLTTISIPRDLWSETLKDKINSAYAYGQAKQKDGGLKLAKAEISAVIGKPISYAAVINFDQFKQLIDFLGGIDVDIERSFVDNQFPIPGKENDLCNGDPEYKCRYKTVSFTKGRHHLTGEDALNFVRSRHAEGEEGSDFARNKRQQKVFDAVKNKLKAINPFNLKKTTALYQVINKSISRDITNQQVAILAKNIFFKRNFQSKEIILPQDFFSVPDSSQYEGKYILLPAPGNFNLIHQYIECQLEGKKNCKDLENQGKKKQ